MDNYELIDGVHCFSINGGDSRTTKLAYSLGILVPIVLLCLYYGVNLQALPIPVFVWFLVGAGIIGGGFLWLSKGSMARYEVRINHKDKSIRAIDRLIAFKEDQSEQELWVDDFLPENLYIAEIQVLVSNQVHNYPVLAYGAEPQPIIEDGVPLVSRTLLGFGEKESVEGMLKILQSV